MVRNYVIGDSSDVHLTISKLLFPKDVFGRLEHLLKEEYKYINSDHSVGEKIRGSIYVQKPMYAFMSSFISTIQSFYKEEGFEVRDGTKFKKEDGAMFFLVKDKEEYLVNVKNNYDNFELKII